jgi:periplasmic divalent cation tolerance protein
VTAVSVIVTSFQDKNSAKKIIAELLNSRLIACGTCIDNGESSYWWEDSIQSHPEIIVILKTLKELENDVTAVIKKIHDYSNPEILLFNGDSLSPDYYKWITSELKLRI